MNPVELRPAAQTKLGARLLSAALALALALALILFVRARSAGAEVPPTPAVPVRPNIVVIQTDDSTLEQLYASYRPSPGTPAIRAMPNTLNLIAKKGATFSRYYVSYSLCAPSRASLLTGRYAHNDLHGNVEPNGGFSGFEARAGYHNDLPVWLQEDGYRTIHVGKYLNGYGDPPYDDGTEVPPGWDAWHTILHTDSDHYFYGYELNNDGVVEGPYGDPGNGETREYGERDDPGCPTAPLNGKPCFYETDKLNELATDEIAATPAGQPFYLQFDESAPHGDFRRPAGPEPPPRYYTLFDGAPLPDNRKEGFDESNVNDKPRFIREAPYLSRAEMHTYRVYYDKALESLRAADDGVKEIVDELGALHELRDTYIIFTSDNGFFYGQHRLTGGKFLAYEPSTHLPFLIRGPAIKPGSESGELVANIDIAPTILELAHATAKASIDGRSLFPFAHDTSLRSRRPILFESFVQTDDVEANGGASPPPEPVYEPAVAGAASARTLPRASASSVDPKAHASIVAPPRNYEGIRLGPYKYIEWPDGEKELYDLEADPYELDNRARDPNYFPVRAFLHEELRRLEDCVGAQCRKDSSELPLTLQQRAIAQREREGAVRESGRPPGQQP